MSKKVIALCAAVFVMCALAEVSAVGSETSRPWSVEEGILAAEAERLDAGSPWQGEELFCYIVPAVSPVRRLPDTLPPDGKPGHRIDITGARGEFVPASFIVAPLDDVDELELRASALRAENGNEIAAENVDIKVVICWWQSGNAWLSYFADPSRRELVPELLLNDENLVRVDLEERENYLRVDGPDGPEYVWISYYFPSWAPERANWNHPTLPLGTRFNYFREPVEDSPVLLPVRLEKGRLKQFWVTVKVPEEAQAGLYEGAISLSADGSEVGEIEVRVRALPFVLPDPKTYYDTGRPFISSMYRLGSLDYFIPQFDGDVEMAEKRLRNLFRNQREHSLFHYYGPNLGARPGRENYIVDVMADEEKRALTERNLELVREAGFRPPLFGAARAGISHVTDEEEELERYIEAAGDYLDIIEDTLGHREVYFWGVGEPGRATLTRQLDGWRRLHEAGVKICSEARPWHFEVAGYAEDMVNFGGAVIEREHSAPWLALGHGAMSYAAPHTGPENPDVFRRTHGMMLYKAWFDGTFQMGWENQRQNWLDFWNPYGFRTIGIVYPTQTDVIDTITWEGFREGVDDVRYATKLKMVADEAIASGDVDAVYAGKRALMWMELADERTRDLNSMRMEMINHILSVKDTLNGGEQ